MKLEAKAAKEDRARILAEKDQLAKQVAKMLSKETQYKHEIRSQEIQVNKLKEQVQARLHKDKHKIASAPDSGDFYAAANYNSNFSFGNQPDQDFSLMMVQKLEQQSALLRDENFAFRNCLKTVQREMIELVKFG